MKIRLYMDVPEYALSSWCYCAMSAIITQPATGFKRVMFDVYVPTKDADEIVRASPSVEVKGGE